ncbi:MFS general substrate transporter [Russula vinacea]|nr:MFS general substrate transporter [Russula vinacea]
MRQTLSEANAQSAHDQLPSRGQKSISEHEVHVARPSNFRARIQFFALCWTIFLAGWSDSSTGPLLPRIQSVYHVGFAVVSSIFIANCIGFVTGSVANIVLNDKLGFGKHPGICTLLPSFVIAYAINGFGESLEDAQANGFVASYKDNAQRKWGFYTQLTVRGVGALAAPLVATQFAQHHRWSFHYLISLAVAILNTALLVCVFKFKTQEECLAQIGQATEEKETVGGSKYREMFKLKALHILALFTLVYVGVEVTIGGWIVTYMIHVRHGGPSSGYISTGFFGGLTVGRVAFLWVNNKIGERLAIFIYVILAIGLELVVWLVPSLIVGRVLPRWLLTGCIGWIAGLGQTGSAALPFMTGAIASKAGIKSLQPLLVSMMGLLVGLWAWVPKGTNARIDDHEIGGKYRGVSL